ncbi:MAG: efflux RND transporter periplasmic adaptor subunit [Rhodocyclaceae bacterium]|nr:efflux RND transporter periplasmic adaptor subunit [Rhodocyclaceae bacterium]MCP5233796.1 efflux RND transporter periplasmic adaptor subunit [Zoogloeaceae bacterium]MCP5240301.1 efflux RND transporter periplasmic adaptor subunit [Zoogloeaceae bacterium]MCP5253590.1 efflux RND transporter periplasmic adaptor subunit [Zoogloeaceae bacterium]MCP5295061.1 efflux RND transporter periplasmic adaptor subunit [Zoogloeaceae bacterium]
MHPASINPLLKPLGAALACAFVLSACSGETQQASPGGAAPPAPTVGIVVATAEPVQLTTELPGRTAAYMVAELRPQVTGIVQKRLFTEGSTVKAGQTLYQIDPATYRATFESAKASLARAEANVYSARLKAQRYADLVKIEAVSKQANDDAIAALKQAEADVASARAAVEKARIDVGFTAVTSPIAGRIGRSSVTAGALVTANQADALATVQQLDPIYVDLTQSSAELLRLKRDLAEGKLQRVAGKAVPVRLVLEDGSEYASEGRLEFSEVSVDSDTGSVTLRAVFPNPSGALLPGMYVRAQLTQGEVANGILVPHAAVSRDPRGTALVMVVGAEDKVESRPVTAAISRGDKWLITDGLAAGDKVIVDGLQKIRPGATVKPQEAVAGAAAPAAAPAAK